MSGYAFHPEAFADLNEIWEFVAGDSLDAADRLIQDIYNAIQSLVPTPHKGHRRSDLTSQPLRFWRVHSYLIAYAPEEHPLLVIAILHGRRNPRIIAAILRGRD